MRKLLTLSMLASPAFGMAPQFSDFEGPVQHIVHTPALPSIPSEGATDVAFGDFDQDYLNDVAYILAGGVRAVMAPGMFEAPMSECAIASALAAVPQTGANGGHRLVAAGFGGLRTLAWNSQNHTWDVQVLAANGWSNVDQLRVHQSAFGTLLIGLDSDGHGLHFLMTMDQTVDNSTFWFALPSLTPQANVIDDFAMVNWDGAGAAELAVTIGTNLWVYSFPLTGDPPIASIPSYVYNHGKLAVLHKQGVAREWLAWVGTKIGSPAEQIVGVVGSEGLTSVTDLLEAGGVRYLHAADYDRDGIDDLIFTREQDYRPGLLISSRTPVPAFTIDPTTPPGHVLPQAFLYRMENTNAAGNYSGPPIVCDMDNDGDLDLALVFPLENAVWINKEQNVVYESSITPSLVLDYQSGVTFGAYRDLNGIVDLTVKCPSATSGSRRIQFLAWYQTDPVGSTKMNSIPFHNQPHTVGAPDDFLPLSVKVPRGLPTTSVFPGLMWGAVRYADWDGTKFSNPGPATCFLLSGKANAPGQPLTEEELFVENFTMGEPVFSVGTGVNGEHDSHGREIPCFAAKLDDPPKSL